MLTNVISPKKSSIKLIDGVFPESGYIKSPLNYIGGKYKILDQILPLFPSKIDTFVDLFAGGFNVGINVTANKIFLNDNLIFLIEMYKVFNGNGIQKTLEHIEGRINQFDLSYTNGDGYREMRSLYNTNKNPLDLFVLVAYSFNHQIRFNNKHEFNNPFGKARSSFNRSMQNNLVRFITRLQSQNIFFSNECFVDFDYSSLTENDFVYCDPPYLITTGTYNDGKRGFKGWTENEERLLLNKLDELDNKGVRFALSNVLEHKQKSNDILRQWIGKRKHYRVNYLEFNYANSNYQTRIRDRNSTTEVLVTNYISDTPINQRLF